MTRLTVRPSRAHPSPSAWSSIRPLSLGALSSASVPLRATLCVSWGGILRAPVRARLDRQVARAALAGGDSVMGVCRLSPVVTCGVWWRLIPGCRYVV